MLLRELRAKEREIRRHTEVGVLLLRENRLLKSDLLKMGPVPETVDLTDEIDSDVNQFRPVAVGLRDYRFMIFDTFGNLIWEDTELDFEGKPMNSWYGDLDNDGNILKQDVYIWKVVGTFKNGIKLNKTGTVTLIR